MSKLQRHSQRQHPLWQLTLMRWRIFVREPAAVFWTYGFPVVLALALVLTFSIAQAARKPGQAPSH